MTTTTRSHAAPWTFRRFLAELFLKPQPRRRSPRPGMDHVLTGREAVARHLFGEAVHWARLDMVEYDNEPYLQEVWLAEADRRINPPEAVLSFEDLRIARWHGYTPDQWAQLPALVKVDKRESFFQVQGLAS